MGPQLILTYVLQKLSVLVTHENNTAVASFYWLLSVMISAVDMQGNNSTIIEKTQQKYAE